MKKFKQFRAEQQYITEVGPFASAMMGAMGVIGLGFAGWKAFKKTKEAIKGYRETKADKKARKKDGFTMSIKTYNPETDKDELQDFFIDPEKGNDDLKKLGYELPRTLTGKIKAPSDDELDKMEKEAGRKAKRANAAIKRKIKSGNYDPDDLTTDQQDQLAGKEKEATDTASAEDEKKKSVERKPAKYWVGKERGEGGIPKSKEPKVRGLEAKAIKDGNGVLDWQDKWETEDTPTGWTKVSTGEGDDDFEYKKTADVEAEKEKNKPKTGGGSSNGAGQGTTTGQDTSAANRLLQRNSRLLKFGEFITEGVMNDLLKAGKSKKDSEITLDDGADIPIDPLTSQILIKYIEGLSSSEKNRTIQQIQRTERAFMKVLGKAHENI